ncbi:MAG TPA: hypothetical protein VGK67_14265 [Myxococcales bacterium]
MLDEPLPAVGPELFMQAGAIVVDGMMRAGACRAAMDAVLRRVVWQAQRQLDGSLAVGV